MKIREDKRMFKLVFLFRTIFSINILKKISTFIFGGHGHSSLSTFGLHLVRGQRLWKLIC